MPCVCVRVYSNLHRHTFQGVAFSGRKAAGALTCLPCHRLMMSPGRFQLSSRHAAAWRAGPGQAQVLHITVLCLKKHTHAHTQVNINTCCMASRQRSRGGGSDGPAVSTHTMDIQNAEIWINMLVLYETHTHKYTCIHTGLTARVPMYQTPPGKASLSLAACTVPRFSPPKKHQLDIHQLQKPHNCNNHRLGG